LSKPTQAGKGKGHPMTCQCWHGGEAAVLLEPIRNLRDGKRWVVNTTPQQLHSHERPGTNYAGGWG